MKKFTAKELKEKLLMTDEEVKIFMEYQRLFPELMMNNAEGFVINGEALWEKLGKPQGRMNDWITRKLRGVFEENVDFTTSTQNCVKATKGRTATIPYLTVDTAKEVSMMTNGDIGKLVRKHFILCEKKLRDYQEWDAVRNPQKETYRKLSSALAKQFYDFYHDKAPNEIYWKEANMLNVSLFGCTAKQVNAFFNDLEKRQTREHFTIEMNQALSTLQIMDLGMVQNNKSFDERKESIETSCKVMFYHIKDRFQKEYVEWMEEYKKVA